jgi:arylsulfatase A-like enzyme
MKEFPRLTRSPICTALSATSVALPSALARIGPIAVTLALLAPSSIAQAPPNIVLILADDLGYGDVGPYDHDNDPETPKVTNTPRLDALATEGVRLTDYYASTPVCTPTRASLLTGRHHARIGMMGALGPSSDCGLPQSEITLAELVHTRGYATALIGKWHLGLLPDFGPLSQGFDTYYGLLYSNDQVPYTVLHDDVPVDPCPDQAHLMQSLAFQAKNFIAGAVAQSKPFFLYMPTIAPHVPVYVGSQFDGITGRGLYADCVYELDWCVGQILDELAQLGVADNTIVVFTSDNGPWHDTHFPPPWEPEPWRWVGGSAAPLRGSKAMVYEGGIREPFLARWPGHYMHGGTSHQPAVCMDLFTTLALAAGATPPTDRILDGLDIGPVLAGTGTRGSSTFVFYQLANRCDASIANRKLWAIRSGKWKQIFDFWENPSELYNLDTDIGETTPLNLPAVTAMLLDKAHDFDCGLSAAPPPSFPPTDLATGRAVFASSSMNCDTSGRAVDGDDSTQWTSAGNGDQWLFVDLGQTCDIDRVVLKWGPAHAVEYALEMSNDSTTWTGVYENHSCNGGSNTIPLTSTLARYVRMHGFTCGGSSYSLKELVINGSFDLPFARHDVGHGH